MITLLHKVDKKETEEALQMKHDFINKRLKNSSPLVDSAVDGNIKNMKNLLHAFANPDSVDQSDKSALQMAVCKGHKDAANLLIRYNVSLDTREGEAKIVQHALNNCHTGIS